MTFRFLLALTLFAGVTSRGFAQNDQPSLPTLLNKLDQTAKATNDPELQSLGRELGGKAKSLSGSLGENPEASNQLQTALAGLLGNQGGDSLGALSKLGKAKLTPEQTKLAKEVGNLSSAYLVQRNFASLDQSQGEVAQIVKSLRGGKVTEALPAIQQVAQNAKLTAGQKDLLKSLTDSYAPGASQATDALDQGLKALPKLGL